MSWVLPGVLRIADHVIVVDNGSMDATQKVAFQAAEQVGLPERLTVLEYPFAVARCGAEHLATPPDSVHSLTYFYNWSFAHVRSRHAMKWDGDMVATKEGEVLLADLSWQLQASFTSMRFHRASVYVRDDHTAYVDLKGVYGELFMWPNTPEFTFIKGFDWEIIRPPRSQPLDVPAWASFEVKWLDENEFDHWSEIDMDRIALGRKRREWQVFRGLHRDAPPSGVELVTSPKVHIIDHLRSVYPEMVRQELTTTRRN